MVLLHYPELVYRLIIFLVDVLTILEKFTKVYKMYEVYKVYRSFQNGIKIEWTEIIDCWNYRKF